MPSKRCSHTGPCDCPPEGLTLNLDNLTPEQLRDMSRPLSNDSQFERDMMLHPPKPGCASCAKDERYVPATRRIRDIPLCDGCYRWWHKDEERQILKDRRRR
jgi:hypothetical protein